MSAIRWRRAGRMAATCWSIVAAGLTSLAAPSASAAGLDSYLYQVEFPPSPVSGVDAIASLDDRAIAILRSLACGSEVDYAPRPTRAGEDASAILIAKLAWATGHPDGNGRPRIEGPCTFTRYYTWVNLCERLLAPDKDDCKAGAPKIVRDAASATIVREIFARGFVPRYNAHRCTAADATVTLSELAAGRSMRAPIVHNYADVAVNISIAPACMVAQLNWSLSGMRVEGQMGTGGAPCHLFGTTDGDWDMSVINFTRLSYLDERNVDLHGVHVVDNAALTNLQDHLLSAAGAPAAESYGPLTGCGNTEESSGSSQERADERDWTDTPFWQTIGDILWFLLKLLAIFFVAFAVALAIVTLFGLGAGIVVAIFAILVGVSIGADIIPETENHLLMINTSKYLKNQSIIADLAGSDSDGLNRFRKDQSAVKEWLLAKMKDLMQREFVEYNSRPYQRLSILAIHNIADFANDDELREGARIILDYTTAKFAVGSQQGRRFVPLRRKRENMQQRIDVGAPEHNGLFDLVQGGDHHIGLGLLYSGQVAQMRDNYVSFGVAAHALFAATSSYVPEDLVVDLAIRKSDPIFQRHGYSAGEVYSSGRSYLISAGGVATGLAYPTFVSDDVATFVRPSLKDDLGLAMPTTLFLAKSIADDPEHRVPPMTADFTLPSVSRTTLDELIRIEGRRHESTDPYPTYDENLCVWDGFACGVNLVVPPSDANDFAAGFSETHTLAGEPGPCMGKGPAGTPSEWRFVDSRRCAAYRNAPRFFIAIHRAACPDDADYCEFNFGFFEIVDAAPTTSFDEFVRTVTAANPPGFVRSDSPMRGTYHSSRGQAIEFQAEADSTRNAGIVAVDGIAQHDRDQWRFAEGSSALLPATKTPIVSQGDAHVIVTNPRFTKKLHLDFSDHHDPKRSVQ